jgi:hypothetical protein
MKLSSTYYGGNDPFEGDRKIWLRGLPAGARVMRATVTLKPAAPTDGTRFTESIFFDENGVGNWGAMRSPAALGATFQAVAELHARRTVVSVVASGDRSVTVQVNMGGTWVGLADDGTILIPEKQPLILNLPVTPSTGLLDATPLPPVTVDKIQLTAVDSEFVVDSEGRVSLHGLNISSIPANISLRLDEKPPFWMHLGELAAAQTSPDFAPILNAFLATAQVEGGFYAIPVVVHSDAIARLDVDLTIEYMIEQPILPSYLPEVTLPYGYSSLPGVAEDILTVKLPRNARPVSASGRAVQGTFDATRVVWGKIGESGATTKVAISSDRTLAQPIMLDVETPASFIDLPLASTEPGLAGLNLALQSDADGTPSGEVLISAEVAVEKPVPGDSAWGSAALPSEFRFLPKTRYWLVLQILSGKDRAFWNASVDQSAPALLASSDGGFSWRPAFTDKGEQPLQALFRLRHTPEHFTVPVQLQIGRGFEARRVKFDQFAPLGRVEFDMDFTAELDKYLASPAAASPCGKGSLLANGSFDLPHHTDATRKLFGIDAGGGYPALFIESKEELDRGIDLSEERFITLSACAKEKTQIDCAGRNPARTWPIEVKEAIGNDLCAVRERGILKLSGKPVLYPWLRMEEPQGWQGQDEAGGSIQRLKVPTVFDADWVDSTLINPRPERVVVVLVTAKKEGEPVTLSQRVSVKGGCVYILGIQFLNSIHTARLYEMFSYIDFGEDIHEKYYPEEVFSWDKIPGEDSEKLTKFLAGKFGIGWVNNASIEQNDTGKAIIVSASETGESLSLKLNDERTEAILEINGVQIDKFIAKIVINELRIYDIRYPSNPPSWEVHWLDSQGEIIRADSRTLSQNHQDLPDIDGLIRRETRLFAPQAATQAELRFIQPPQGFVLLDDASFTPTSEALSNGRFQQWEVEAGQPETNIEKIFSPTGWERLGGVLEQFHPAGEAAYLILRGNGPDDSILAQRVEAKAGERLKLIVIARPEAPSASDVEAEHIERRARLELRWLADGTAKGEPAILPLDGRNFATHSWAGETPAGINGAEIRLIQPHGQGNLLVESVSLQYSELVPVPLLFLSEAPGELTVSDLRVDYDLHEAPQPLSPSSRQIVSRGRMSGSVWERERVPLASAAPVSPLADLEIRAINRISEHVANTLEGMTPPIITVFQLAALDPETEIQGLSLSRDRRLILKAAAETILSLNFQAKPFSGFPNESLDALLALTPAKLAEKACQPIELAMQLQRSLRSLKLLLKNDAFRGLQLSDLMPR